MLVAMLPSALMGYSIFRYNFLDLRVQRNFIYTMATIFGLLLYLNFMRRLSGWLEPREVLPAAVTESIMIFVLVVLVEPCREGLGEYGAPGARFVVRSRVAHRRSRPFSPKRNAFEFWSTQERRVDTS
jgi:hypothetical protein